MRRGILKTGSTAELPTLVEGLLIIETYTISPRTLFPQIEPP